MINITITAPPMGGKTVAAMAIHRALTKLGAKVRINEGVQEELTPLAIARKHALITSESPILSGIEVEIITHLAQRTA